ncbi:MAG: hypothetical protein AB7P33_06845 [Dehalococcoidia bacterium]
MTEANDFELVPWKNLPVSEPVLAGDASKEQHQQRGWTIWYPAMITVIAGITTQEAHRLLQAGSVVINGETAADAFGYIRPGAQIEVAGVGRYRIGEIEPPRY